MPSNSEPLLSQEPTGDITELKYVFRHVGGFYAKYFEDKSWSLAAEQAVQNVQLDVASAFYMDFLKLKSLESFSAWLARLQSMYMARGQIRQVYTSEHPPRAIVHLVAPSDRADSSSPPPAADARVLGEFSVGASNTGPESVLRFCKTARQVFQARPTRRFLHGFQIRGSTMELWVFDRSGAYSSGQLDMIQRPSLLIKIMASYAMMNDEEVGFTSIIRRDDLGSYVAFCGVDENETERLYLEDKPIAAPEYLVGPGTTCYAARAPTSQTAEFVVKFAWREEEVHREREMLELTKERKVWGVIRALGWQDLGSIGGQREGLQFDQPYDFMPATVAEGEATVIDKDYGPPIINRTFSCIATSPLGRSVNQFETTSEFLEACRDVAKALRSLYQDGNILHRDICVKNLIISARRTEGDAKGVLIDLDGALDLEKGPARRGELVGSEGFMAIGILTGDPHTYRHDLESLFYVFLWVAICNDHDHDDERSLRHQPETSRLWGWCSMNFRAVSQNKLVDMSLEGFPKILGEFSTEFKHLKGLARGLHQLLFPIRHGAIFTGTDIDEASINSLYDGVIEAFNEAIASPTQY